MYDRQATDNSDDNYSIQIPPDLAPDDALEVVVGLCHELRHPLKKIDSLLAELQSNDPDQVAELQQWMEGVRYILNIVYTYDNQRPTDEDRS